MEYFVIRKVSSDCNAAADFSSISDKAFRLFKKGYIQRIEVCLPTVSPDTTRTCFLRCKAHPQMKDKLYSIEVAVEQVEGEVKSVLFAKCDCPAGKPPHGSCKHLAAFSNVLEEFCCLGYTWENVAVTADMEYSKREKLPSPKGRRVRL